MTFLIITKSSNYLLPHKIIILLLTTFPFLFSPFLYLSPSVKGPEINSRTYRQLRRPRIHNGEMSVSSTSGAKKTGYRRKYKTGPHSYTIHKNKFKGIKHLNVQPNTIRLLGENTGNKLFNINLSNAVLGGSPGARET